MNTNESVKATGQVKIVVTDAQGNIKQEQDVTNLVVTTGRNFIASRMVGTTPAVMSHMAIGAGSTAAALADTALGSELGRSALSAGSATDNVVTYTATFGAGVGTGAVTEAGILNNSSGGTLLCRVVFAVVNKGSNDTMAITWTVTVS